MSPGATGSSGRKKTWAETGTWDRLIGETERTEETTNTDMLTWLDQDGKRHNLELRKDLEILGALISKETIAVAKFRLGTADAAFWQHTGYFCSLRISWAQKLKEYIRRIRPIALFGSVLWTWDASIYALLRAWENRLLRRMIHIPWNEADEDFGTRRRRHTRICQEQLAEAQAEDIATAMLQGQFRWAAGAHSRFARDLLHKTSRRAWPRLESWSRIVAAMRDHRLPAGSKTWSSSACAPLCFMVNNDEEGWRVRQTVFLAGGPPQLSGLASQSTGAPQSVGGGDDQDGRGLAICEGAKGTMFEPPFSKSGGATTTHRASSKWCRRIERATTAQRLQRPPAPQARQSRKASWTFGLQCLLPSPETRRPGFRSIWSATPLYVGALGAGNCSTLDIASLWFNA